MVYPISMRAAAFAALMSLGLTVFACGSDDSAGSPASGGVSGSGATSGSGGTGGQSGNGATAGAGAMDAGVGGNAGSAGSGGAAGDGGTLKCFDFSNDPNLPLAIDGVFSPSSEFWRRPHDEPEVCPATALLPASAAEVPQVVYAFCNNDTKEHTYSFELLSQAGPKGEPALDDPYLVLYTGIGIPSDAKQCLAINDDIPNSLNTTDSEILDIKVPAGGAVTAVGTTVTYSPSDTTGQGYYIMVVSNTD